MRTSVWTRARTRYASASQSHITLRSNLCCRINRLPHICTMSRDDLLDFLREMVRLADENAKAFNAVLDSGELLALADRSDLVVALWRDAETPFGVRLACLKGKDDLMSDGKGLRDVRTSAVWCSSRQMADALAQRLWHCSTAHFTIN